MVGFLFAAFLTGVVGFLLIICLVGVDGFYSFFTVGFLAVGIAFYAGTAFLAGISFLTGLCIGLTTGLFIAFTFLAGALALAIAFDA
jgi:hypothetical protein